MDSDFAYSKWRIQSIQIAEKHSKAVETKPSNYLAKTRIPNWLALELVLLALVFLLAAQATQYYFFLSNVRNEFW